MAISHDVESEEILYLAGRVVAIHQRHTITIPTDDIPGSETFVGDVIELKAWQEVYLGVVNESGANITVKGRGLPRADCDLAADKLHTMGTTTTNAGKFELEALQSIGLPVVSGDRARRLTHMRITGNGTAGGGTKVTIHVDLYALGGGNSI